MNQDHAIAITMDQEIKTRMQKSPKKFAGGKESCCIFRVPESRLQINKEAYQPEIVSIGPYHHGNNKHEIQMTQEQKWRYLGCFLTRTGKPLQSFSSCIISMENEIRQSYSESVKHIDSIPLARMMLLDGVFLIELFRKTGGLISVDQDDPLFYHRYWVPLGLMVDLLKVENQIPFFVLQKLFDESQTETDVRTLPSLILEFFNRVVDRPNGVLQRYVNLEGRHLLDLFRKSFIRNAADLVNETLGKNAVFQPATKLVMAGVRLKANLEADTFLDIGFQNGILSIPKINICDDFYDCFFLNTLIYEEYHSCSKEITTYVKFLRGLISTLADVGVLSESSIIANHSGLDNDILEFLNKAGKSVDFRMGDSYLRNLSVNVDRYCENRWLVGWDGFKRTYCSSTWHFIRNSAAFGLFCFGFLQAVFTVYPYFHPRR